MGLATDGTGSNDTQNMFEALRIAGVWHNRSDRDYPNGPLRRTFCARRHPAARTRSGWAARLGVIEAGRLADLVMLTTNSYHFVPLNDVINQLVYCENGISVTDVMIDGRWVLRQGKLLTIDETHLYARARALREEMDDRVKEQFRRTAEIEPALRQQYLKAARTPWSDRDGA